MAPKTQGDAGDSDFLGLDKVERPPPSDPQQKRPPMVIVWFNVVVYSILHLSALYGLWLLPSVQWKTLVWIGVTHFFAALGVTAGSHRLWSHRSYKARLPLRIFLATINCVSFQNSILEWARDHRVHHKFSETDADPHNATRGFFFSHVGWLLVKKHPDVKAKGKTIDLSDLKADPVVMFQDRHFYKLGFLMNVAIPTLVPVWYFSESLFVSFFTAGVLRYILSLHATWLVNSAAHKYGMKPYDHRINPSENVLVSALAIGEGFHNYHHTFPQDYRTSEYGWRLNPSTLFIDLMCYIGQAYDLKKVSPEVVKSRSIRTGDGSHSHHHSH